jgi:hypothetical protein
VVEHRLEPHDQDVTIHRRLAEAEDVQRRQHTHAGEYQLQHVLARAGQPVHRLHAVMYRVETPQERHLVIRAVRPVLRHIRHQHTQQQLRQERDVLHGLLEMAADQPAEHVVQQEIHRQQRQPHDEMVHREMLQIGLPFLAEDRLALVQRKQLLDHHEDQGRAEQVQDEPVQPDIRRVVGELADRHARTAQRHRRDHQHERHEVEVALAIEDEIAQRDATGRQQADQQQLADDVDRILVAQIRRGQVLRKVERQYRQQAQEAQRQRDDAGDHAAARRQLAVGVQQFAGLRDRRLHGAAKSFACSLAFGVFAHGDPSRQTPAGVAAHGSAAPVPRL